MDQQPHTSIAGTRALQEQLQRPMPGRCTQPHLQLSMHMAIHRICPPLPRRKPPQKRTSVKNNTRTQGTKRHQLPLGVVSRPNRQAPRLTAAQQGFALSASKQGSALSAAQQGFALSAKTLYKPGAVEAGCTSTSLRQPQLQYAGTRGMQQHLMHVKHMRTNRIKLLTS